MENKELLEIQDQEVESIKTPESETCECGECNCEEYSSAEEKLLEIEAEKELFRLQKEIYFDEEGQMDFIESSEFQGGLREGATYAGFYTALINAGVSVEKSYELTMNFMTGKINKELALVELEKAKVTQIQVQSSMI